MDLNGKQAAIRCGYKPSRAEMHGVRAAGKPEGFSGGRRPKVEN